MGALNESSPYLRAQANLSELKLDRMSAAMPDYVRMVADGDRDFAQAMAEMTDSEVVARRERVMRQRIRSSGFPYVKTLADFDWSFQPSVPRAKVEELATLRFMDSAENVLLVGSPGVGKTHLAVALGIEAVKAGREVRFTDCARLVDDLKDAQARGILKNRLKYYAHSKLLIIDELGYLDIDALRAAFDDHHDERGDRRMGQGVRRRRVGQRHRRQDVPPLHDDQDNGQVLQAERPACGQEKGRLAEIGEKTVAWK